MGRIPPSKLDRTAHWHHSPIATPARPEARSMTRTVPPVIPHKSEGLGQAVAHPGATAREMVELPLASMRRHRPDAARYSSRPVDTHGQSMDRELVASRGWEPGDRLGWRIRGGIAVLSS